jgi:hypothetical protein
MAFSPPAAAIGVNRTERFVAMLQLAEKEGFCEKLHLIDLQNRTVDPRFRDTDYRRVQNYVGESVDWRREKAHFASPKPGDLDSLMAGLIAAHSRMEAGSPRNRVTPYSPEIHGDKTDCQPDRNTAFILLLSRHYIHNICCNII